MRQRPYHMELQTTGRHCAFLLRSRIPRLFPLRTPNCLATLALLRTWFPSTKSHPHVLRQPRHCNLQSRPSITFSNETHRHSRSLHSRLRQPSTNRHTPHPWDRQSLRPPDKTFTASYTQQMARPHPPRPRQPFRDLTRSSRMDADHGGVSGIDPGPSAPPSYHHFRRIRSSPLVPTSDVPARLGLKAPAWAWLLGARA